MSRSSQLQQSLVSGLVIGLSVFCLDQLVGGVLWFSLVYSTACALIAAVVAYIWIGRAATRATTPDSTNSRAAAAALSGLLVALFVLALALGAGSGPGVAIGYALIAGVVGAMVRYLILGRRARRAR